MRGNLANRAELRRYYREREEFDLAGYRRGTVTAGEYQVSACFAGIAAYSLEARRQDWTPKPPGRRAFRTLGRLRWGLCLT
jgi:hypothetical protein